MSNSIEFINLASDAEFISGTNRADRLVGTDGDDVLVGGLGSDVLTGGAGNDVLVGDQESGRNDSRDRDTFVFGDVESAVIGNNIITDFDTNNFNGGENNFDALSLCLLYTSPSPRDQRGSRMPSSA